MNEMFSLRIGASQRLNCARVKYLCRTIPVGNLAGIDYDILRAVEIDATLINNPPVRNGVNTPARGNGQLVFLSQV